MAWLGTAWLVTAMQAWHGWAECGKARQLMVIWAYL